MSSVGIISANPVSIQQKAESSDVEIEIYAYIFVDGMSQLDAQQRRRDLLNKGITIARIGGDSISGEIISKWVNPRVPKDNGSTIEDDLHLHVPFFLDLEYGILKHENIINKVDNLKRDIGNYVDKYLIDDNVKSIKIHFLLLIYNQLDVVANLLYPLGKLAMINEAKKRKYVENIFADKKFLEHQKIKYKDVEVLISVNPFGLSKENREATFVSDSNDYKKIIKDADEPLSKDVNTPETEDIQDAAVLCQYTYDSQGSLESSIPNFIFEGVQKAYSVIKDGVASIYKSVFTKENIDIILKDTTLNFETKESRDFSYAQIISKLNGVIDDLSCLGVINTGSPPVMSGELLDIIMKIPNLISKCQNLSKSISDNFKEEISKNLIEKLENKVEEKLKIAQIREHGIAIYHTDNGYGLVHDSDVVIPGKTNVTVYDEVCESDLKKLIGPVLLIDYTTGFYSKLYKERNKDKYFYCTAGTNMLSWNDWNNNISQGLLGLSQQYTQSVRIAKKLDEALKNCRLFFIGHSLGGGLASNNSLVTQNRHAITFNAAGLNFLRVKATLLLNNRKDLFHPKRRTSKIHAYVIEGELLNKVLSKLGEGAYGTKYVVKEDRKEEDLWDLGSLGRHSLADTFLKLKRMDQISISRTSNF